MLARGKDIKTNEWVYGEPEYNFDEELFYIADTPVQEETMGYKIGKCYEGDYVTIANNGFTGILKKDRIYVTGSNYFSIENHPKFFSRGNIYDDSDKKTLLNFKKKEEHIPYPTENTYYICPYCGKRIGKYQDICPHCDAFFPSNKTIKIYKYTNEYAPIFIYDEMVGWIFSNGSRYLYSNFPEAQECYDIIEIMSRTLKILKGDIKILQSLYQNTFISLEEKAL